MTSYWLIELKLDRLNALYLNGDKFTSDKDRATRFLTKSQAVRRMDRLSNVRGDLKVVEYGYN